MGPLQALIPDLTSKTTIQMLRVKARILSFRQSPIVRFLALFTLILVLLILRRPGAITNPQFWAEDGRVFFFDQITRSGPVVLFKPHAGYLHLIPRLTTALAALFGPRFVPLIMNVCALVLSALCCSLLSLNRYRYLLQSDWMRIMLCLVMATAFQSDELVGTVTCVQFFLFIGTLLMILQPAEAYKGKYASVLAVMAVLLCGLSSATVVLLLPLCVWIAIKHRGTASLVPIALASAAVMQICVYLWAGSKASDRLGELAVASLVSAAYRMLLTSVLGIQVAEWLSSVSFQAILLVTMIAATAWLTSLWRHSEASRRWKIVVCTYVVFASIALPLAGRSLVSAFSWGGIALWRGERYFFVASCMFAYLVALSLERWLPARKWTQVFALAAVFAAGICGNFRTTPFIDYHWPEYAPKVERWIDDTRSGRPANALAIPINPPAWKVELAGTAEGSLVVAAGGDGKVYMIQDRHRRWIPSPAWAEAHGYKLPDDVGTLSAAALDAIPLGPRIEP
jgi:hypothetical protein